MSNNTKDTKEKILSVAGSLFAKHGYDNTSIRDISKEAGVNLASINYHFKNKLNLYKEVMNASMVSLELKIDSIIDTSKDLKTFYTDLYSLFRADNEAFSNGFKLFVVSTLPETEDIIPEACAKDFGPPGFKKQLDLVTKEVGEESPLKGREWLVRTIFSYIAHSALMMGSSFCRIMEDKAPFLQEEEKKKSIENLVESTLNFLREHPEKFK